MGKSISLSKSTTTEHPKKNLILFHNEGLYPCCSRGLYQHYHWQIIITANITRNMKESVPFQKDHLELKEELTHHHHHTNQPHMPHHHQSMLQLQNHTASQKRNSHHNHTNSNME